MERACSAKKGDVMTYVKEIGLIAAGFVLGTVGVKALASDPARKLCVQAVSKGLQIKAAGQDIIEQAKSNVDDIVAEANYLNEQEEKDAAATGEKSSEATEADTQKDVQKGAQKGVRKNTRKSAEKK
jgi:hypothetical protein